MGVHTVQNHPDAAAVGLTAQFGKVLFRTQHGVGGLVIAGVVAVAGKALGNGVQVDKVHAQPRDIVHFLGDTPEISTEKVVVQHFSVLRGLPVHVLCPAFVHGVGGQLAGKVAVAGFVEAVGEDLIDGSALGPVRGVEIRRDAADLPQVPGLHVGVVPLLEQAETTAGVIDIVVVEVKAGVGDGKHAAPYLIGPFHRLLRQADVLGVGFAVLIFEQQRYCCGSYRAGDVDIHTALLAGRQGSEGGFILGKLAVVQNSHGSLLGV